MTRTFSDGHPKVLPACNFLSQYYFYNIFLQKSCRFSLQTLTKFEAAKTGSGVGFLRLTAVCAQSESGLFPDPFVRVVALAIFDFSNAITSDMLSDNCWCYYFQL